MTTQSNFLLLHAKPQKIQSSTTGREIFELATRSKLRSVLTNTISFTTSVRSSIPQISKYILVFRESTIRACMRISPIFTFVKEKE